MDEHSVSVTTGALPHGSSSNPEKESLADILPPEFYYENGFRKVRPYWHEFRAHAKGRWIGRKLLDVFRAEFHSRYSNYFEYGVKFGRITVNGKRIDADYLIKDSDVIRHLVHRHELPILNEKIEIIDDRDGILAVNKPCSIPVHVCVCYRLDRATSGLLLFAKDLKTDQKIKKMIESKKIKKEYVCKVEGVFPDGEIICEEPLDNLIPSMGVVCVTKSGKASYTRFEKMFSERQTSVVRCFPETGRTHQIRVHLQFLGFPIINDVLYNCSEAFGPKKGKNGDYGKPMEQVISDVKKCHDAAEWVLEVRGDVPKINENEISLEEVEKADRNFDPLCPECRIVPREPPMEHMNMFLHCLKYESPEWSFSTPLPDWATCEKSESI